MWLPSHNPSRNPDTGTGSNTLTAQKPSTRSPLGRLRYACLLCREEPGNLGLDAGPRKGCPKHGRGSHIQKIRV